MSDSPNDDLRRGDWYNGRRVDSCVRFEWTDDGTRAVVRASARTATEPSGLTPR